MWIFKKKKQFNDFDPILKYQIQQHEYNEETNLAAKADFIHNLAKEYLSNLMESSERLQKKVILLLSFYISAISFCAIKITNILQFSLATIPTKIFTFFLITIVLYSIEAIFIAFFCFYPKEKAITGNEPINLIQQDILDQHLSITKILATSNYQKAIDINLYANNKVASNIKLGIALIIIIPIISVIFSLFA